MGIPHQYQIEFDEWSPTGVWLRRITPPHPENDAIKFAQCIAKERTRNVVVREVAGAPIPTI